MLCDNLQSYIMLLKITEVYLNCLNITYLTVTYLITYLLHGADPS